MPDCEALLRRHSSMLLKCLQCVVGFLVANALEMVKNNRYQRRKGNEQRFRVDRAVDDDIRIYEKTPRQTSGSPINNMFGQA